MKLSPGRSSSVVDRAPTTTPPLVSRFSSRALLDRAMSVGTSLRSLTVMVKVSLVVRPGVPESVTSTMTW